MPDPTPPPSTDASGSTPVVSDTASRETHSSGFNAPPARRSNIAARPEKKPRPHTFGQWIGHILHVLLTPVLWLVRPLVYRVTREPGNPRVEFTSFSSLIYLWPIMVVGWVNGLLLKWDWVSSPTLGWIWITVVFVVAICIGADVSRNKLFALTLAIIALWFGGILLRDKADFPILSYIHQHFADMHVQFEPGTARVFSNIILIVLVGVVINAWFDGRYEISTREISHRRLLQTSDSLPRAAKRVKREWRDLAEFFLGFGAGDITIIDTNKSEVMRIPNVPFLWFFGHDIDHILEVLATTDVDDAEAAADDEG